MGERRGKVVNLVCFSFRICGDSYTMLIHRPGGMVRPRTERSKSVELTVPSFPFYLIHVVTPCVSPCITDVFQDLGRRLRDAESRAQQAQPELAAKDRELEVGRDGRGC